MLGRVDIRQELVRERERRQQDELLMDLHERLNDLHTRESRIQQRLGANVGSAKPATTTLKKALFSEQEIQRVCTRFRLRFLHTKHFKNTIPLEAVHRLRRMEEGNGMEYTDIRILAPANAFQLCDANEDPLLFVPNGDGKWVLVHQWGNDLSWWRQAAYWPFRNLTTLITSVLLLAFIVSSLFPNDLLTRDPNATYFGAHRIVFFIWSTMVLASFTVYAWFTFFGKFSKEAWNERTFN